MSVMDGSLLEWVGVDPAYYIIGLVAFALILLIIIIVQGVKIGRLHKRMDVFMSGEITESFEKEIKLRFDQIAKLQVISDRHTDEIKEINDFIKFPYSKMGIVKYDAFREMGGNLSFALCMLNENNDGMLLNAMHSHEGCYTYIKEIIGGESYLELSEEEQEALGNALNVRNYMDK